MNRHLYNKLKGKKIYIFGIDGSGKTTLINSLKKEIGKENIELFMSYSNGGPFIHSMNKNKPYQNDYINLLHSLDHLYKSNLIKHRDINKVCIIERYFICNWVYSKIFNFDDLRTLKLIHDMLETVDIFIYLSVNPKIALNRIYNRTQKPTLKENIDKLILAQRYYEEYIEENNIPVIRLNTENSVQDNLNIIYKYLGD